MTQELLEKIFNHFNVAAPISYTRVEKGFMSHNYSVVTTDGVFFLKQRALDTLPQIDSIERAEQFFAEHGIPIVSPFLTKEGFRHVVFDDKCYVLSNFIDGIHLERGNLSVTALGDMAELLAKIHLLTKDGIVGEYTEFGYFKPRNKEKILSELFDFISLVEAKKDLSEFDILALSTMKIRVQLIEQNSVTFDSPAMLDRHLCHGDYHADNMFFTHEEKVSHLFDFDMTGPAPRMYEVVRTFMLSCFDHVYSEDRLEQSRLFIFAYNKKYPFTEQEFADAFEAYYVKQFWSDWIEKAHYVQGITRTDVLYKPMVDTILYLKDNRQDLLSKLSAGLF
jgi:Ser/Thr protein kinase RdoA (MazF antagonist)